MTARDKNDVHTPRNLSSTLKESLKETPVLHQGGDADVLRARKLIGMLLTQLEEDVRAGVDELTPFQHFLWGQKENVVSVLGKLTQMLVKLSEIIPEDGKKHGEENDFLTSEEVEILRRYAEQHKCTNDSKTLP